MGQNGSTVHYTNETASVKCVMEFRVTREKLQKFAADIANIELARSHTPYHRKEAGNKHQVDFIDSLRRRYAAMRYEPDRVLVVKKFKLPKGKFDLRPAHSLRRPILVEGVYRPDEFNHVDFANKNIGGGFLTYGMAQEEVLMCERPDFGFFVAMMYSANSPVQIMHDEALIVEGADTCAGIDFYGRVPDTWHAQCCYFNEPKRNETAFIAIDCIRPNFQRYKKEHLIWCIRKAYCGFQGVPNSEITTGQWGCGAFFNNKNVMFCVQVLAAWLAHKKLFYHASTHHVKEALEMVTTWGTAKTEFHAAFNELVEKCISHDKFVTSFNPEEKKEEFLEVKLKGNVKPDKKVVETGKPGQIPMKDFRDYAKSKWPEYAATLSLNKSINSTNSNKNTSPKDDTSHKDDLSSGTKKRPYHNTPMTRVGGGYRDKEKNDKKGGGKGHPAGKGDTRSPPKRAN